MSFILIYIFEEKTLFFYVFWLHTNFPFEDYHRKLVGGKGSSCIIIDRQCFYLSLLSLPLSLSLPLPLPNSVSFSLSLFLNREA